MDLGAFDFIIALGEREKLLSISATVLKKIYNVSVRRKLWINGFVLRSEEETCDLKYHCVHKCPTEPDFLGPNWHQEQMQLLPWAEVFRNNFVYNSRNYLDQAAQAFSHICT